MQNNENNPFEFTKFTFSSNQDLLNEKDNNIL